MKLKSFSILILVVFISFSFLQKANLPKGFVDASDFIPNLKVDLRYATSNNFIGKPIDGYYSHRCILTKEAALALKKVDDDLNDLGFCLQVYDSYRPQKAVNHFVKWARNLTDTLMKQNFYPNVAKNNLFKDGYISSKSRHSSGSTIDLTIFSDKTNSVLDMGSKYDFFGKQSNINYSDLSDIQISNRKLLNSVMLKNGFRPYPMEWWHYTLRYEPYRNVHFDFNIE